MESPTRALAALTDRALSGIEVSVLMAEAVQTLVSSLGADCGVLFEGTSSERLAIVTSVGSSGGPTVGHRYWQEEYALEVAAPVVVADLGRETRFAADELAETGMASALSVIIKAGGAPYGVLSAYASTSGQFTGEDTYLAQAVANVVAMAIERDRDRKSQERADQRDRLAVIGELAAGVAHDFNNIVAAISIYTELLETQQRLDEVGHGYLGAVREQIERGTSLVWQVLDLAHRSAPVLVDVDLASFLDQLVPLLRRTLPEGVRLTLKHDGQPHWVRADTSRLQQIFMNLISNANHAMEGSGQVTIPLSRHGVDSDEASPLDNPLRRPSIRVDVVDTGAGMSPEVLTRAFEPFFTTKTSDRGTGLGLAQVNGLVAQHGGHIDVSSVPGRGTVVSIWLAAGESSGHTQTIRPSDFPRGQGERVLVVDDDPAVRSALTSVLNWLGYDVVTAESGEVAFSILEVEGASIAAVVGDAMMPSIGGIGLAWLVAERWPELHVILLSRYPVPADSQPTASPRGSSRPRPRTQLQTPFSSRELAVAIRSGLRPA
jgi:signal transduction histidine kinase